VAEEDAGSPERKYQRNNRQKCGVKVKKKNIWIRDGVEAVDLMKGIRRGGVAAKLGSGVNNQRGSIGNGAPTLSNGGCTSKRKKEPPHGDCVFILRRTIVEKQET